MENTKNKLAINGGNKTVPDGLLNMQWPVLTQEDEQAVIDVIKNGVLSGADSPQTTTWQKEWAEFVGVKYCLATNSGTAALHMAVAAAGIEPGDEVITTAFSWTSTATCILHHNGIPVFVDIDPQTFNIDPEQIEEKITDKTKAILPVHLYGLPADMDRIKQIAEKHGLLVIEDACQSHGAEYKGQKTGSIGDMAAFSTQNSKHVACGEGGLFVTDNEEYYQQAARLQQFGENRKSDGTREFNAYGMGWMYRTTEIASALARSQFKRLEDTIARLRENCDYLTENLSGIKGLQTPFIPDNRKSVFWNYKVRFVPDELGIDMDPGEFAQKVVAALKAEGVFPTRWEFILPTMTLFQEQNGYGKGCPWKCPNANPRHYHPEDYPEASKAIASIIGIHGIFPPNGLELMKYNVDAFHKVFDNLDKVLSVENE